MTKSSISSQFSKFLAPIGILFIATAARADIAEVIQWSKQTPVSVWNYGLHSLTQYFKSFDAMPRDIKGAYMVIENQKKIAINVIASTEKASLVNETSCATGIRNLKTYLGWNAEKKSWIAGHSLVGAHFAPNRILDGSSIPADYYQLIDNNTFISVSILFVDITGKQKPKDISCWADLNGVDIKIGNRPN